MFYFPNKAFKGNRRHNKTKQVISASPLDIRNDKLLTFFPPIDNFTLK